MDCREITSKAPGYFATVPGQTELNALVMPTIYHRRGISFDVNTSLKWATIERKSTGYVKKGVAMGDLVVVWALMMSLGTAEQMEVSPIRWVTQPECELQRERLENEKQRVQPNYFCVAMLAKR